MKIPHVGKGYKAKKLAALASRLEDCLDQPANQTCADCSEPNPKWACLLMMPSFPSMKLKKTMGVFCCHKCCNYHIQLGREICEVKNTKDIESWTSSEVAALEYSGNGMVNSKYEARMDPSVKSNLDKLKGAEQQQARSLFVQQKYAEKKYFDNNPIFNYNTRQQLQEGLAIARGDPVPTSGSGGGGASLSLRRTLSSASSTKSGDKHNNHDGDDDGSVVSSASGATSTAAALASQGAALASSGAALATSFMDRYLTMTSTSPAACSAAAAAIAGSSQSDLQFNESGSELNFNPEEDLHDEYGADPSERSAAFRDDDSELSESSNQNQYAVNITQQLARRSLQGGGHHNTTANMDGSDRSSGGRRRSISARGSRTGSIQDRRRRGSIRGDAGGGGGRRGSSRSVERRRGSSRSVERRGSERRSRTNGGGLLGDMHQRQPPQRAGSERGLRTTGGSMRGLRTTGGGDLGGGRGLPERRGSERGLRSTGGSERGLRTTGDMGSSGRSSHGRRHRDRSASVGRRRERSSSRGGSRRGQRSGGEGDGRGGALGGAGANDETENEAEEDLLLPSAPAPAAAPRASSPRRNSVSVSSRKQAATKPKQRRATTVGSSYVPPAPLEEAPVTTTTTTTKRRSKGKDLQEEPPPPPPPQPTQPERSSSEPVVPVIADDEGYQAKINALKAHREKMESGNQKLRDELAALKSKKKAAKRRSKSIREVSTATASSSASKSSTTKATPKRSKSIAAETAYSWEKHKAATAAKATKKTPKRSKTMTDKQQQKLDHSAGSTGSAPDGGRGGSSRRSSSAVPSSKSDKLSAATYHGSTDITDEILSSQASSLEMAEREQMIALKIAERKKAAEERKKKRLEETKGKFSKLAQKSEEVLNNLNSIKNRADAMTRLSNTQTLRYNEVGTRERRSVAGAAELQVVT